MAPHGVQMPVPQPLHSVDLAGLQEVQQQQQQTHSLRLQRLRQRRNQEQRHMSRQAQIGTYECFCYADRKHA